MKQIFLYLVNTFATDTFQLSFRYRCQLRFQKYLRRFHQLIFIITCSAVFLTGALPDLARGEDVPGSIQGQVNYCSQGGKVGMQIFIPGRQFMVISGRDGHFLFEKVPPGKYEINYTIGGQLVNANFNVNVLSNYTTDLGTVAFCDKNVSDVTGADMSDESGANKVTGAIDCKAEPQKCEDADKDGVIAANDCNDNDKNIYPGAIELCDGVDNNCNGKIDDARDFFVTRGLASCDHGKLKVKSCSKGFANCDGKSDNGCETDIYNDHDNCGGCNNSCAPDEVCHLGIC